MTEALESSALERWKRNPAEFVEQVMINPETGKPFELLDAERAFMAHAYQTDTDGRLLHTEQCFGAPKKSGKTGFAGMHVIATALVHGGRNAEGYCVANDFEQAQGRVFQAIRRICEASPLLRREAEITNSKITFPSTGATITALASDYAGAAGSNPTISCFDELWGYTSEKSRRLWDEMVHSPARRISCRFTTTYAGFEGESVLLEELYKRGLGQPEVGTDLHAGDGILLFWSHVPVAPWQDEKWLADMRRSLRPSAYLRQIENRFVSTESNFVEMDWWDGCVDPQGRMVIGDRGLPIYVGIDASVKHDSTAVVATTWNKATNQARLVWHRIFQPTPDQPLDFEATVEATVRHLHQQFRVKKILYDPYQLQASAQRLRAAGIRIEEFPQSVPNLTEASQNLYELIKSGNLIVYPDADIRKAVTHAVAKETTRGWRITKEKQSHKIDVVVALGMAALAAARDGSRQPGYASVGTYNHYGLGNGRRGAPNEANPQSQPCTINFTELNKHRRLDGDGFTADEFSRKD